MQASFGIFDSNVFLKIDKNGDKIDHLFDFGEIFMVVFLILNLVLLLNFVIAILTSTFTKFEE